MQVFSKRRGVSMIVMVGFLFTFLGASEIKRVHNSLNEIQDKEGRLQLTLIREWSGEDEVDQNKIFSEPKDVAINDEGEIHILDENRIQFLTNREIICGRLEGRARNLEIYWIPLALK